MMAGNKNYKYLYELDNGIWISSNQQWAIGDRIVMSSVPKKAKNDRDSSKRDPKGTRKSSKVSKQTKRSEKHKQRKKAN